MSDWMNPRGQWEVRIATGDDDVDVVAEIATGILVWAEVRYDG